MLTTLTLAMVIASSGLPQQDVILDSAIRRVGYAMFHQPIEPETVDRLDRVLEVDDILDLQSTGGDIDATIAMARMVRDRRVRVRTTAECSSGCAIVWLTAPDRLGDGFAAILLHGNPISALAWMRENPAAVTASEKALAERTSAELTALLNEAGVSPWLMTCAYRLQNQRHIVSSDLTLPSRLRFETTEDYQLVWFPRSILEQAGVRGLDRYDEPNARQRQAIETEQGTRRVQKKILWAKDGDCDADRTAD